MYEWMKTSTARQFPSILDVEKKRKKKTNKRVWMECFKAEASNLLKCHLSQANKHLALNKFEYFTISLSIVGWEASSWERESFSLMYTRNEAIKIFTTFARADWADKGNLCNAPLGWKEASTQAISISLLILLLFRMRCILLFYCIYIHTVKTAQIREVNVFITGHSWRLFFN